MTAAGCPADSPGSYLNSSNVDRPSSQPINLEIYDLNIRKYDYGIATKRNQYIGTLRSRYRNIT